MVTEVTTAGLTSVRPVLEAALGFHHAVLGNHIQVDAVLAHLGEVSASGDHAYFADLVRFMDDRPNLHLSGAGPIWLADEHRVRERWRALVLRRRTLATAR
ncbi:hypothetical protein [Streptomyces sp. SGAir0957]